MKTIIAGGRNYEFTAQDIAMLDDVHEKHAITEVVSGGANGADLDGEMWATSRGVPVKRFVADWGKHGKAAGPIRNSEMAKYADALIAFPGSIGTADMIRKAKASGLLVVEVDHER